MQINKTKKKIQTSYDYMCSYAKVAGSTPAGSKYFYATNICSTCDYVRSG